jgi:hypothetical protein
MMVIVTTASYPPYCDANHCSSRVLLDSFLLEWAVPEASLSNDKEDLNLATAAVCSDHALSAKPDLKYR